jgi:hypothetical protein
MTARHAFHGGPSPHADRATGESIRSRVSPRTVTLRTCTRPFRSSAVLSLVVSISVAMLAAGLTIRNAEPAFASGPTPVSGTIGSDTTWTLDNSPYIITGVVTVSRTATLTVEPGVVIRFQRPASFTYRINVRGRLVAVGTAANRITITSDRDPTAGGSGAPAPGDYFGVVFSTTSGDTPPSAGSLFRNVDFDTVAQALHVTLRPL